MAINKQELKAYVNDLFSDFMYYNRKEDEDFTVEDAANLSSIVSKEELIEMFVEKIEENYR